MDSKNWFEGAYKAVRILKVSFGYCIGPVPDEWMEKTFGDKKQGLEEIFKRFYNDLPNEKAFAEEKQKALPSIIQYLSGKFENSTGISFGSVVGDIDIALIGSKDYRIKNLQLEMIQSFPMLDFYALRDFASKTGTELGDKLVKMREKILGSELNAEEKKNLQTTINNSELLWGDPKHFEEFKKYKV